MLDFLQPDLSPQPDFIALELTVESGTEVATVTPVSAQSQTDRSNRRARCPETLAQLIFVLGSVQSCTVLYPQEI